MKESFAKFKVPNESAMLALGAKLAGKCPDAFIIFLYGQLGAGKTTFTRGFLRGLGFQGLVKSPTYTLVESYSLPKTTVYHFDFYRLHDPHELEYMGIQDYFSDKTICLIEWPDYGAGMLPTADLSCHIERCSSGRELKLIPGSERGHDVLYRLENNE